MEHARDSNTGLNVIFFADRSRNGGGIFAPGLPLRDGVFTNYTNGAIDCYHTSYWATNPDGAPRRTANLRKNSGFHHWRAATTMSPDARVRTGFAC